MLPAVPDRGRSPSRVSEPALARLAVSTTASAAALGLAIGVTEQSAILGVVFAVVGAGLRLTVAAWRRMRSLPVEAIDPYALPEPWRGLVQRAVDAGRRFRQAVEAWPAGPLRERLVSLEPAVDSEMNGVWVAARQGATVSGGYPPGSKRPSLHDLSAELEAVQLERSELAPADQPRRDQLDRAETALAAQVEAARHAELTSHAVADRLGLLVARLEEAVTAVVALTAGPGGVGEAEENAVGTIEGLAQEISALRAGLGEAFQLPGGAGTTGVEAPSPPATP